MVNWLILYLFLVCATILDCRSGRIPNILICTICLAGGVWYGCCSSQELFFYCLRIIGFFLVFVFLFFIKALGGGDVKCIMVVGGLVGVEASIFIIFYGFFLASIVSVFKMIRYGILKERMRILIRYLEQVYYGKKWIPYPVGGNANYELVRLSLFFLLGAIWYQFVKGR